MSEGGQLLRSRDEFDLQCCVSFTFIKIQVLSKVYSFALYLLLGLYYSKLCHPITFRENILIKIHFDESAVKALLHFYSGI